MIQPINAEKVRDYDRMIRYGRAMMIALRRIRRGKRFGWWLAMKPELKRELASRRFVKFAVSSIGRRVITESESWESGVRVNVDGLYRLFGRLPSDLRD